MSNKEVKCNCASIEGGNKMHYCTPPSQTKEAKCTCGYEKDNGHAPTCPLYQETDFSIFAPNSQKPKNKCSICKEILETNYEARTHYCKVTNSQPEALKDWEKQKYLKIKELFNKIGNEPVYDHVDSMNDLAEWVKTTQQKDFNARVEGFIKEAEAKKASQNELGEMYENEVILVESFNTGIDTVVALAKQTLTSKPEK